MAQPQLHRIRSVSPGPGYRLRLAWDHGGATSVDLSAAIAVGGVYDAIAAEAKFARVRAGEYGRSIEWPEPAGDDGRPLIAIDAEALHRMAKDQSKPERLGTVRKLVEWSKSMVRSAESQARAEHKL